MDTAQLEKNLEALEGRIARACARAGRREADVQLVAVSKLHPPEVLRRAYACGIRHFGENYAQELRDKQAALADLPGIRWHAIGPVQTKNAKYIAKAAHVFHALEKLEIAAELSKRRTGEPLDCLVEVNVAREASKAGIDHGEVAAFVEQVRALPNLKVTGLMTMPPLTEDPEAARLPFRALHALGQRLGLRELSMGSTHDFEVAIEEGATLVRVGTALFGERPA
ncbi:MAG: YggS family pyridoxal phosphate-dependent enzyme [Myxococcaceae bacterium]|nr:YggS family pyridoxal phosphate-dependent enzyme [Myxococcaceae bacterium]